MRFVGGACVGLAACVGLTLGCASTWKPPPEQPPPPAPYADTPSTYKPFGIGWDAGTRKIACGQANVTVSEELASAARLNGKNELTIVPPGSPPGAALMARVHDPADRPERPESEQRHRGGITGIFDQMFDLMRQGPEMAAERLTLGNEVPAMLRLHELASGQKIGDDDKLSPEMQVNDDLLEMNYTIRDESWRLVGLYGDVCVIMTIERVFPNATHTFADVKAQMRAAAKSLKLSRNLN